jgi:hypothetical protein
VPVLHQVLQNDVPLGKKDENPHIESHQEDEKISRSKDRQNAREELPAPRRGFKKNAEKTGSISSFLGVFLKPLGGAHIKEPYRSYFLEH